MTRSSPRGFTLIELLVVITIIVVLLALLTPALDKAVYQAQLAACGANQHSVAVGAISYASENKRAYPFRPHHDYVRRSGGYNRPDLIRVSAASDDRLWFREHILPKLLRDPLVEDIDMATAEDVQLHASIALWYGVTFRQTVGSALYPGVNNPANPSGNMGQGIVRIGDRLEWAGELFNVLVSDLDTPLPSYPFVVASHPDKDGVLFSQVYTAGPMYSRWGNNATAERGPIDTNYTFQDASVARYNDVKWNDWELDSRMADVAMSDQDEANFPDSYQHLPRR